MEVTRVALIALALSFIFPNLSPIFFTLASIFSILPKILEWREREKADKNAIALGLRISSLPVITEKKIAEEMEKFNLYSDYAKKYKKTGKFEFPIFGRRSSFLSIGVKLALRTGNREIMEKAVKTLQEMEEISSEVNSLLSTERYTLIGSFAALGLVFGIISKISPFNFFPYLLFQSLLSSLWLRDITEGNFFETLAFTFIIIFTGFYLGAKIG